MSKLIIITVAALTLLLSGCGGPIEVRIVNVTQGKSWALTTTTLERTDTKERWIFVGDRWGEVGDTFKISYMQWTYPGL